MPLDAVIKYKQELNDCCYACNCAIPKDTEFFDVIDPRSEWLVDGDGEGLPDIIELCDECYHIFVSRNVTHSDLSYFIFNVDGNKILDEIMQQDKLKNKLSKFLSELKKGDS